MRERSSNLQLSKLLILTCLIFTSIIFEGRAQSSSDRPPSRPQGQPHESLEVTGITWRSSHRTLDGIQAEFEEVISTLLDIGLLPTKKYEINDFNEADTVSDIIDNYYSFLLSTPTNLLTICRINSDHCTINNSQPIWRSNPSSPIMVPDLPINGDYFYAQFFPNYEIDVEDSYNSFIKNFYEYSPGCYVLNDTQPDIEELIKSSTKVEIKKNLIKNVNESCLSDIYHFNLSIHAMKKPELFKDLACLLGNDVDCLSQQRNFKNMFAAVHQVCSAYESKARATKTFERDCSILLPVLSLNFSISSLPTRSLKEITTVDKSTITRSAKNSIQAGSNLTVFAKPSTRIDLPDPFTNHIGQFENCAFDGFPKEYKTIEACLEKAVLQHINYPLENMGAITPPEQQFSFPRALTAFVDFFNAQEFAMRTCQSAETCRVNLVSSSAGETATQCETTNGRYSHGSKVSDIFWVTMSIARNAIVSDETTTVNLCDVFLNPADVATGALNRLLAGNNNRKIIVNMSYGEIEGQATSKTYDLPKEILKQAKAKGNLPIFIFASSRPANLADSDDSNCQVNPTCLTEHTEFKNFSVSVMGAQWDHSRGTFVPTADAYLHDGLTIAAPSFEVPVAEKILLNNQTLEVDVSLAQGSSLAAPQVASTLAQLLSNDMNPLFLRPKDAIGRLLACATPYQGLSDLGQGIRIAGLLDYECTTSRLHMPNDFPKPIHYVTYIKDDLEHSLVPMQLLAVYNDDGKNVPSITFTDSDERNIPLSLVQDDSRLLLYGFRKFKDDDIYRYTYSNEGEEIEIEIDYAGPPSSKRQLLALKDVATGEKICVQFDQVTEIIVPIFPYSWQPEIGRGHLINSASICHSTYVARRR